MKRTAIALLLASLIVATQAAAAESAFPQGADGEPRGEPEFSTYADRYLKDPVQFSESPQTDGTNVR